MLVRRAKLVGLDGVVITEHNRMWEVNESDRGFVQRGAFSCLWNR
jgi:predicted metal-dependent phosphoesterase TrpH